QRKGILSFACLSCPRNKVDSETTRAAFQSEEIARDTKLVREPSRISAL
ncbi:22653_t:CDS:2, partial [Dentiscutata erythropus]